jgi:hypothetical protein
MVAIASALRLGFAKAPQAPSAIAVALLPRFALTVGASGRTESSGPFPFNVISGALGVDWIRKRVTSYPLS